MNENSCEHDCCEVILHIHGLESMFVAQQNLDSPEAEEFTSFVSIVENIYEVQDNMPLALDLPPPISGMDLLISIHQLRIAAS